MLEILKPYTKNPEKKIISRVVEIIQHGGIVAYPTETFYGLGTDATNEKAIEKIFSVKGRNFKNPISLIIGSYDDIYPLVKDVPESAQKLMDAFWPGALTIVFAASDKVSPMLTARTGKIGLRISSHPIANAIALELGKPLTATSANLSGSQECFLASEVIKQIGNKIDAILDWGKTRGGKTSTVIDVTCSSPVILREGAVGKQALKKYISYPSD